MFGFRVKFTLRLMYFKLQQTRGQDCFRSALPFQVVPNPIASFISYSRNEYDGVMNEFFPK